MLMPADLMDVMWCSAMSPTFWHPIFSPLFVIGYLYNCRRVFVYLYLLATFSLSNLSNLFYVWLGFGHDHRSNEVLFWILISIFIKPCWILKNHQGLILVLKPRRGATCSINLPAKLICHDFQQQQIILWTSSQSL